MPQELETPWFVYVARCQDGTLYTGIARDVAARIRAHDAGRGARYTRGRGPLALCVTRRCRSKSDALRLEVAIKRLSRHHKEKLMDDVALFRAFASRLIAASRRSSVRTATARRAPLVGELGRR